MSGASLELQSVGFHYEDMVMSFDLEVEAGSILAIIGPSGAGKSTLLSLIAGFEQPTSGRILIDGADMSGVPPAHRPVDMLFQEHNLFPHLSAAANVGLGIRPDLKLTAADRERVSAALARVGLAGFESRLPGQMSGGERQRTAIARCLLRRRPVLLLDEPFASLGPALRRDMLELVCGIQRESGATVLLVTHNPGDARLAATHTAFVLDGRVRACRRTADLFAADDLPELADYLGTEPRRLDAG